MTSPLDGAQKDLVGDHIEPLLCLALDIDDRGRAECIAARALRYALSDCLAGERNIADQRVQITGRVRVPAAFLDQETGKSGAIGKHGAPSGPKAREQAMGRAGT